MDQTLREKLIEKGWVTNFNADSLIGLIERHYAETSRQQFPGAQELFDLWDWMEDEWRANNDGQDLPVEVYGEAVLAQFCRCYGKPAIKEKKPA